MDNITLFKIAIVVGILMLVSRRILELSLSILASTTALIVSLVGIIISMILLTILAIPATILGCAVAERVDDGKYMTGTVAELCRPKRTTKSRTHFNKNTEFSTSEVEKY